MSVSSWGWFYFLLFSGVSVQSGAHGKV